MSKLNVILSDLDVPNTGALTDGNFDYLKVVGVGSLILGLFVIAFITTIVMKKRQHKFLTAKGGNFKIHKGIKTLFGLVLLIGILGLGLSTANRQIAQSSEVFADEEQNSDSLSIKVDDVTIEANLSSEDQFATAKNIVTVSSPAANGYTLSVYANNQDLTLEDAEDEKYTIKGLETETPAILESNTWGISLVEPEDEESEIWQAMPNEKASALILKDTNNATPANDQTEVYYGVKVNDELAAGTYSNTINYLAVANGPLRITIEDAYNTLGLQKYLGHYVMQDMNEELCNLVNILEDEGEAQLIDIRDNKLYYVAKLADGHCWMTQNLDLDIEAGRTYTPADTDIPSNWTPTRSTTDNNSIWCEGGQTDARGRCRSNNTAESFDPGDWYFHEQDEEDSPHNHAGNYYNWTAAIAMNESSEYNTEETITVDQSICPTGWALPRAGIGNGSFYNLLKEYGFTNSSIVEDTNIWSSPLYFVASASWNKSAVYAGWCGGLWTATTDITDTAYAMDFNQSGQINAGINYSSDKYYGIPVRCVSRPVPAKYTSRDI